MQTIRPLRKYLDDQKIFQAQPTSQNTGPIHPITLLPARTTGTLPVVVAPPVIVKHVASTLAPMLDLSDMSRERILQGYRLAWLHQRIAFRDALYVVQDVYFDSVPNGKLWARMVREDA